MSVVALTSQAQVRSIRSLHPASDMVAEVRGDPNAEGSGQTPFRVSHRGAIIRGTYQERLGHQAGPGNLGRTTQGAFSRSARIRPGPQGSSNQVSDGKVRWP